jgi:hypothetical protein
MEQQHNAHMHAQAYNNYKRSVLNEQQYNAYMQLTNATVIVHDEEALGTWKLYVGDMYNDGNCTLFEHVYCAQCLHTGTYTNDAALLQMLGEYALCEQLQSTIAQLAHLHKLWEVIPAH